ncbi:MAG TPA: hypothetical protein VF773_06645 [Verrucomicrobiae bacterium]
MCVVHACARVTEAHSFSAFQAGDGGWQMAAPAVGNIDSDAALEIVVAYRSASSGLWMLDAFNHDGSRVGGFPYNGGGNVMNVSPTLADVNGDGTLEILFTAGRSIVALRGNGTVLWRYEVTPANYIPDAGFMAVTNVFYMTNSEGPQPSLPGNAEFYSEVSSPIVADIDGNGSREVLTAWKIDPDPSSGHQDYNPLVNDLWGAGEWGATGEVWSGGVIVSDAATGAKRMVYHFHQLVEAGLAVAQLDSDRALEVLVLNDADAIAAIDWTETPGFMGENMLHRKFGKNLRLLSGSYQTGVDVHAADIDGDGMDEVLVPSTQINPNWQPHDSLLDDDGSLIWREWKQAANIPNVNGWLNNAALIPVNPDRDNRVDVLGFSHTYEITFRSWNGVQLVSRPGWPKSFAPLMPTPPVVGDVDGDSSEEIVIGTYDPAKSSSSGRVQVFALDGTQKYSVEISSGMKHIPAIADVDSDGHTEVVLRALDGKVHILSFGNGGSRRISWATHRGNAARSFSTNLYPAGTPIITAKAGSYRGTEFSWRLPEGHTATAIKVYRADSAAGPFVDVATLDGNATDFADAGRELWSQYFYEVAAVYGGAVVRSAPFAIVVEPSGNLIGNGHFEADDNAHWDKWFTGDIPWENMTTSTANPHGGGRSMEIRFENHTGNSTIVQSSHYGTPEDYIPVTPGKIYSFGGFIRSGGLSADSEHWFEWDSSRTGENKNARPSLPYPNYFTPSMKTGAEPTAWTYLNRVFDVPPGFPNVQLRHRLKVNEPVSGSVFLDNIFFRELPDPTSGVWDEWLPFGATWKYFAAIAPPNWFAVDFNDSLWLEGKAKFGEGGGPKNIITALPKYLPAYYFRRTFRASPGARELLLAATCTDDYASKTYPLKIWLNGTEILTGGIDAVSGEGNVVKYFDLTPFLSLVRPGTNLIAVMLQNTWQPTWDNIAFDLSLRAIPHPISDKTKKDETKLAETK